MKEILENIEVIVFDWDGTLVDSVGPKIEQNRQLAEFFGNPLTNEEVRQYWAQARDYQELMQMLCPGVDMSEIQAEVDNQYNNPEFRKKRMGFNANYLIHTLSSHDDIKTAIATSIPRELFVRDANSLGIRIELSESESGLSFTQTSDETDFKKPDGNFFKPTLKFFREVGITAEKIMYIGDEKKDIYAARDAGMIAVGVTSGLATATEFKNLGAIHIPNAYEILSYT